MLRSVTLSFTDVEDLVLPLDGITVFVGPNNSGKSLVLREIERMMQIYPQPGDIRIVKDYDVEWKDEQIVAEFFERIKQKPTPPHIPGGTISLIRRHQNGNVEQNQIHLEGFFNMLRGRLDKHYYAHSYVSYGVVRLDGRSRFGLTDDQPAGDLLATPETIVGRLFVSDESRQAAREYIRDAFGLSLVVDPTNLGHLRMRLSQEAILDDEQSLNEAARLFHQRAIHVKDASDGVQAYVGIISSVVSGEYHTLLIDEPEAFLHPPLARKLGRQLAKIATERKGSLLASTHSADFLMGCVQATPSVRVVRMEYQNGRSKGRLVDSEKLRKLFQNPLMRSTNATSALFYDGVIVTESDNDRAFYAEIYHRLANEKANLPSILFINAQNKQTIKDIMGPLRLFGVPAAAIPDVDLVKDGGKVWTQWLSSAQIPEALHQGYQLQRQAIYAALKAKEDAGLDMKRDGGLSILSAADKSAGDELFDQINKYGIFPVRHGELEQWLKSLRVAGTKTDWTINMLDALGSDPEDPEYVRPEAGDVWDFLRQIIGWIADTSRKGTA